MKLGNLLQQTDTRETLVAVVGRQGSVYCSYLSMKLKVLNKDEWLVDGELHNGAHFPLAAFTKTQVAGAKQAWQNDWKKSNAKRNREWKGT